MAIKTAQQRRTLADAYASAAKFGAIYTTVPGAAAGTEPSGGTPAYARKSLTWSAATDDGTKATVTATVTFDVPSGVTIAGAGLHTALTAGTYLDGAAVTSQAFSSQGTYEMTFTYSQT